MPAATGLRLVCRAEAAGGQAWLEYSSPGCRTAGSAERSQDEDPRDYVDVFDSFVATVGNSADQLVLLTTDALLLLLDDQDVVIPWSAIQEVDGTRIRTSDAALPEIALLLYTRPEQLRLIEAIALYAPEALSAGSAERLADSHREPPVRPDRITTLPHIPGHMVVDTKGLVVSLDSASGWTAGWKGRQAWARVIADLGEQASAMGANAVVGATASAFGAGGGVTNIVGGDAVGVLLMGTAVIVVSVAMRKSPLMAKSRSPLVAG